MLIGYKTYIAAAVAAYLTGEASLADAAQIVVTALLGVFIRSGVKSDTGTK